MNEVVYLKNGSILRGFIIEQVPNTSLKVQLRDKSIVACRYNDVEKITKENVYTRSLSNDVPRKPALAWMWSFFFPGAGQIYNGQTLKGALMMAWGIISIVWFLFGFFIYWGSVVLLSMFFISMISLWLWSQIDAPVMAHKINER